MMKTNRSLQWIFGIVGGLTGVLLGPLAAAPRALAADAPNSVLTGHACSSSESWNYSARIEAERRESYDRFLSHKVKPVEAFSEAIALRRFAKSFEGRAFGEYWISRALFEAGLHHIAEEGFLSILSHAPSAETSGVQLAALDCLMRLQEINPSFSQRLPDSTAFRLSKLLEFQPDALSHEIAWDASVWVVLSEVSAEDSKSKAQAKHFSEVLVALHDVLRGGGAYDSLARGIVAARLHDHATAIAKLQDFLAASLPKPLRRYVDTAHILLAHSLYTTGAFDLASAHLKQVSRSSNELASSLSELTWSYLQAERYPEAIGTAMNLEAGGLRHTFEPEAPMVMAMAMNELCQYPESVKAISLFRKNYEKSYRWLATSGFDHLYPLAVQFIRKQGQVPDRVASEWVRSPLFLSSQNEINLLFKERDSTAAIGLTGSTEERRQGQEILKFARDLKQRLRTAKMRLKAGQGLPPTLTADLATLRKMVRGYRRLEQAAPVWRKVLAHYRGRVPGLERNLVERIDHDLKLRSIRMLAQLEEIAENIQLIEVEIYNGASKDIIWQNAHPDYKQVAERMTEQNRKETAGKVWNWGRAPASDGDEPTEIWEDELGSFKANLYDNCSSKDRYLALKLNRRSKQ